MPGPTPTSASWRTPWIAAALLLGSALLASACATRRVDPVLLIHPVVYELELRLEAETTWRRVAAPDPAFVPGQGAASPLDSSRSLGTVAEPIAPLVTVAGADLVEAPSLDVGLAPLVSTGMTARMELMLIPSPELPDGSRSWRIKVIRADGDQLNPDDGGALVASGPTRAWTLAGRSFGLRTFADGEVLAIDDGAHVSGPDRLLDVFNLLLPVLSPFPPPLEVGAVQRRDSRWPITAGRGRSWRHVLNATWENEGALAAVDLGSTSSLGAAWRLRWSGPLRATGRDTAVAPPIGVKATGTAQGVLDILADERLPVPLRVLRHSFVQDRTVEVEYPGATGGPLRLEQTQRLTGALVRVPRQMSRPVTSAAYPTVAEQAAAFAAVGPSLASCGQGQADGAYPLRASLAGDGSIGAVDVLDAPAAVADCVEERLGQVSLSGHDEDALPLQATIVLRAGVAVLGPVVDIDERVVGSLFVFLPPDQAQDLRRYLGLASPSSTASEDW